MSPTRTILNGYLPQVIATLIVAFILGGVFLYASSRVNEAKLERQIQDAQEHEAICNQNHERAVKEREDIKWRLDAIERRLGMDYGIPRRNK